MQIKLPGLKKDVFGNLPNGRQVDRYTLEAATGIKLQVITYGGIITSLYAPDKLGHFDDIVLGFDSLKSYMEANPYFGAIIGRFGNRVANGRFELAGKVYQLATNNGNNHLHGGNVGFDKVVWRATKVQDEMATGVKLTYRSHDMEEGYPGNLDVEVTYLLNIDDELEIRYLAKTDQTTIINLTNHSYFNLGNDPTILNHHLQLNADRFLPVDGSLIPIGELRPVKHTPFDFSKMKCIGESIDADHKQVKLCGGFDHCWVLNASKDKLPLAARLYEPDSGRILEVYSKEPGIQFYTGNFLDGTLKGKNDKAYNHRSGLCLETQHYPDSPNQPQFPSVVLKPGEQYSSITKLVFSTQ